MSYTVWLYGLPSSGKTTLARELHKRTGYVLLDGDNIRKELGLKGYASGNRNRIANTYCGICNLINESGVNCILCTNSVTEKNRNIFRNNIDNLIEVYVYCSLKECMRRDNKGLYKKSMNGEIANMPGIDMEFEEPQNYDIKITNEHITIGSNVNDIEKYIHERMA